MGYELLKKYETVFDYKNNLLLLYPIDKKGKRIGQASPNWHPPTDSLKFSLVGHIPSIITRIGNRRVRLGIDTGAEVNLFDKGHKKTLGKRFASANKMQLYGVSNKGLSATVGRLRYLWIDCLKFKNMVTMLTDMDNFNQAYNRRLDGILGQEFIKQRKISFNFKKRKIYFWGPEEENCHLAKK